MIREFGLRYGINKFVGRHKNGYYLYQANTMISSVEFYYIEKYITRKLNQNNDLKEFTKTLSKEDKILYLYLGINFTNEKIEYFPDSRSLFLETTFDYNEIKTIKSTNERADKILELIQNNAHHYEYKIKGITQILKDTINEFKQDNYQNIWEFSKKRIKGVGTAKLICELTPFRFYLKLTIEDKNKKIIFNQIILETLPDSLCYHHTFKSLIVTDNQIIITDRIYNDINKNTLYKILLEDIFLNKVENRETVSNRFTRFPPIPSWLIDFEKYINGEILKEEYDKRLKNFIDKNSS